MRAKDFLLQIEKIDKMIENKTIEREQWESIAYGVTATPQTVKINGKLHNMDKVQPSGNPHKMANAIVNYLDYDNEIKRLAESKKEIIKTLERLDVEYYDILHKIYVQYITLSEYAKMKDKSYRQITNLHGQALQRLQKVIDDLEKEIVTIIQQIS